MEALTSVLPVRGIMKSKKEAYTEPSIAKRWKEQVLVLIKTFEHLDSAVPEATYF